MATRPRRKRAAPWLRWVLRQPNDAWVALWTALLVMVTGGTAYVLWQTDHTLKETLALQRETSERQLRAYVGIEGVDLIVDAKQLQTAIKIKNTGQTPAFDLAVTYQFGVHGSADVLPAPVPPAAAQSRTYLTPGGTRNISGAHTFAPPVTLSAIEAGTMVIYGYGRIDYRDTFGQARFVTFRMYGTRLSNGAWQMLSANDGNDAN